MKKKPAASYVGDCLVHEVPTCGLHDSVAAARQKLAQMKAELCAVINREKIVLGAYDTHALETDSSTTVEQVMQAGPKTLRPSYPAEEAAKLLRKSGKKTILVTSSDGKLMGAFTNSG